MTCGCYIDQDKSLTDFSDILYSWFLKENYGVTSMLFQEDYSSLSLKISIINWEEENKI